MAKGVLATDGKLLHANPHTNKPAWCAALVQKCWWSVFSHLFLLSSHVDRLVPHTIHMLSSSHCCFYKKFEAKLSVTVATNPSVQLVLVNHWPLRRDTLTLFKYPQFAVWCGTRAMEEWHVRFHATMVVTGHIELRQADQRRGER